MLRTAVCQLPHHAARHEIGSLCFMVWYASAILTPCGNLDSLEYEDMARANNFFYPSPSRILVMFVRALSFYALPRAQHGMKIDCYALWCASILTPAETSILLSMKIRLEPIISSIQARLEF